MEKLKKKLEQEEYIYRIGDLDEHKGVFVISNDLDHQNDSLDFVILQDGDYFIISDDHLVEGELFLVGKNFDEEVKKRISMLARRIGVKVKIKDSNEVVVEPISREDILKEVRGFNKFLKLFFEDKTNFKY